MYLKIHVKSVHKGNKTFRCEICDACFTQKCDLVLHMESVHASSLAISGKNANEAKAGNVSNTNLFSANGTKNVVNIGANNLFKPHHFPHLYSDAGLSIFQSSLGMSGKNLKLKVHNDTQ
jgi:hypothetical protein